MLYPPDERINVLAPVVRGRKGEFKKELASLRARGFTRARIDGAFVALDGEFTLDRRKNHTIDVLVDRLIVKPGIEKRLTDSVDLALRLADDIVVINSLAGGDRLFSRRMACPDCGISIPEMTPRAFSFNSPHGACPECQGLGAIYDFDPARVVPDNAVSLSAGAIAPWQQGDKRLIAEMLEGLQRAFGISPDVPFGELPKKHKDVVLYGAPGQRHLTGYRHKDSDSSGGRSARSKAKAPQDPFGVDFEGVIPSLRRRFQDGTWTDQETLEPYRGLQPCPACEGERLRPESRAVRVKGRRIAEFVTLPTSDVLPIFENLELTEREQLIANRIVREIRDRLRFLNDVGVGYLSLGRSAATLSGGEGQRIRLATQIGSQLTGVLYVLDEPSIGLHQRDNRRLLGTLCKLRNLGNTVLVVEHDEETIRTADYLIDLGPGAGERGGLVMFTARRSSPSDFDPSRRRCRAIRISATTQSRRMRRSGSCGWFAISACTPTSIRAVRLKLRCALGSVQTRSSSPGSASRTRSSNARSPSV